MDSFLAGHVDRLRESGTLLPGEVIVDVEVAGFDGTPGMLAITDQRILHLDASPFSKTVRTSAVHLGHVEAVKASERRSPIKKRGVLTVSLSTDETSRYVFDQIEGGVLRAERLAEAIRDGASQAPSRG